MESAGIILEITTLIVPGMNDSADELCQIARFIASVNPLLPWHLSRFHPDYKMRDNSVTPVDKMNEAVEIGLAEGLKHVYTGNMRSHERENTYCSGCGELLIRRSGYQQPESHLKDGKCPGCGGEIPVVR